MTVSVCLLGSKLSRGHFLLLFVFLEHARALKVDDDDDYQDDHHDACLSESIPTDTTEIF